ncbi:hypothetical protein ACS8YF_18055 [Salinisphaera sp. SWV1]|uniref:hypothetical protein n=1 Tax=Salinisphaera sp. SWV1 TaxID=3454139 RepID=UPI003F878C2C
MDSSAGYDNAPRIKAWRCIGCGKLEAPQLCIGICQDRRAELVDADYYEQALSQLQQMRREKAALRRLLQQLAYTMPHDGQWEHTYRYLQSSARKLLAEH